MSSWGVLLALSGFSYSAPGNEDGLRPEDLRRGFPDVLDDRVRLGDLRPERGAGKGLSLRLEAGTGAVELKDMVVTLPAEAEGKALRSVKGTLGGAAITSTTQRTGNAVRIQWLKPVRVEPGKPLELTVQF